MRELSFEVRRGCSVMLMGPNGCGKSSLFRVLAGLWPLQAGEITSPPKHELFYLSQRPYLVVGTLRDQLLYPKPPARVWEGSMPQDKRHFVSVAGEEPCYHDKDEGECTEAGSCSCTGVHLNTMFCCAEVQWCMPISSAKVVVVLYCTSPSIGRQLV